MNKNNRSNIELELIKAQASLTDKPFSFAFKASLGVLAAQALVGLVTLGVFATGIGIIGYILTK